MKTNDNKIVWGVPEVLKPFPKLYNAGVVYKYVLDNTDVCKVMVEAASFKWGKYKYVFLWKSYAVSMEDDNYWTVHPTAKHKLVWMWERRYSPSLSKHSVQYLGHLGITEAVAHGAVVYGDMSKAYSRK